MKEHFSVCLSVYRNDNAIYFIEAVRSVYNDQHITPSEIIIIVDGIIPKQIESSIQLLVKEIPIIRVIRFSENRGHAATRQAGLEAATNNLVAIMDADDLAVPDRFEKQISFMVSNPSVAVLGGQIMEFINSPLNIIGIRQVPEDDADIKKYLKSRCPMNLVTVMYRKDMIHAVGGFMEWYCEEDYYLWIRMTLAGCRFANLPDTLVNVRVGKEMYRRRGGWKYFKSEKGLQDYMLRHRMISLPRYCYNVLGRFVIQVAMPNKLRGFIFQKLFRK